MNASTTARRLSEAIGQATKSCKFCVAGCLPDVDPGIEVDGLGAIKLPLKRATAKRLVAIACAENPPIFAKIGTPRALSRERRVTQ